MPQFRYMNLPTILLIEDDELNSDMLSRRLRKRDFTVIVAEDGESGVSSAVQYHPDVILLDVSLPDIDGWECTRRIRSNPLTRDIPIIALTGHTSGDTRVRALEVGCNDYDTKPINFERLIAKISACS